MSQGGKRRPALKAMVALGSNQTSFAGSPVATVAAGIRTLAARFGGPLSISSLYSTPAFPPGAGADYCNAVVSFRTTATPDTILSTLHRVERSYGRDRTARWAARTLDLDLLAVGDLILPDRETLEWWMDLPLEQQKTDTPQELILPHPRLTDRPFVLVPLADVEAGWTHPVTGQTVAQMVAQISPEERQSIRPIA